MAFAAGSFTTGIAPPTTGILAAAMTNPGGAVVYENGATQTGPITVGGRLRRAGNGEVGVSYLRLTSQVSTALTAKLNDVTALAAATDVGALWTGQVLTNNLCNLPSNFGPGNGNWTLANVMRLSVRVRAVVANVVGVGGVGALRCWPIADPVAGDITIFFENECLDGALGVQIDLRYRHSVEG